MALVRATSIEKVRSSLQVFADALADWLGTLVACERRLTPRTGATRTRSQAGLVELRQRMLS